MQTHQNFLKEITLFLILFLIGSTYAVGPADVNNATEYHPLMVINETEESSITLGFELGELKHEEIKDEETNFDFFRTAQVLRPEEETNSLPTIVRYIQVPPQSGIDVQVRNLITRTIRGERPFLIKNKPDEMAFAEIDHRGFYPSKIAQIGKPMIMRGIRIAPIIINPVRFNEENNEIEIIESMELSIDFSSQNNKINLVDENIKPRSSRSVNRILNNLIINYSPDRDEPDNGGSVVYIIGNWDNIEEELQPLIEWRRRMGWTAEILRVASASTNAIKAAIQEAYDEWDDPPEHVVIVGDTDGSFPRGFYDTRDGSNWPYETDHKYIELEGDDVLPDATVGRFIIASANMCRDIVEKTVLYESDPYLGEDEERGWQTRGVLVASDNQSGTSSIDMCLWIREIAARTTYNSFSELYWNPGNPRPNARATIMNGINEGCSFFVYRGYLFLNGFAFTDVDQLRNGRMLPFVILATCNTGDYSEHVSSTYYYSERFNYVRNSGAIGCVGTGGATHTAYNNLITASTMKAFIADSIYTQGWALMNGKVDLFRNYADRGDIMHEENRNVEAWLCEFYIFNLMGDPTVDLYTDVPRQLIVEHPETILSGDSYYDVTVSFEDDESLAEDVLVCLYKPDTFQLTARTNSEGQVSFVMNPEWVEEGEVQLTVTGHNLMPELIDLEIEAQELLLGNGGYEIDDDADGQSNGDGDGIANQTERLELAAQLRNFGNEVPEGAVSITLTTEADQLEVIEGEIEIEAAPEPGESEGISFVVEIGGGFSHNEDAEFNLEISAGDQTWNSALIIPIEGPSIAFSNYEWVEEPLVSGGESEIRIALTNNGSKPVGELQANLISLTPSLGVPEANAVYEGMERHAVATANFTLGAHPLYLEGVPANYALAVESENGFIDTTYFSIRIFSENSSQPFGPDAYGYVCFDNTDTTWFIAPEFEWIEISPAQDGNGVDTELEDRSEEDDMSIVMNLPFIFTYYGEDFEQITICTNGWAALGDHGDLTTGRNRRIPSGMVGSSMLCPFWEDLITTNDGGIYTWFDEDENIFIIEWENMRKLGPRGNGEPLETFQIILQDPEHFPSFTGDGGIIFQYLDVTDDRSAYTAWDTPFATVGLGSPDQHTGLEYSYWGDLNSGAAPLDSGRAILFTTLLNFELGAIEGNVLDVVTNDPVSGVLITTTYGFKATTDDSGYYLIEDVLIDTSINYLATTSKLFYNDSTVYNIQPQADDTIEVSFGILHPEFDLDFGGIDVSMEQNNASDFYIPITNTGSGPMEFTSSIEFTREDPERDDTWDEFLTFDVTNAQIGENEDGEPILLGNGRINGIAFVDTLFYISGGGDVNRDWFAVIYRFDRAGAFVDSVSLPWIDRNGLRAITYDGTEFIYGCRAGHIFQLNKACAVLDSFPVATDYPRGITYSPDTGSLFTFTVTTDIWEYDIEGNLIRTYAPQLNDRALRKYGLAYYPNQPDSLDLFILNMLEDQWNIFGYNMETEEQALIYTFTLIEGEGINSLDVTSRWNSSVWTLNAIINHSGGDKATILELDPNLDWLSYTPSVATIEAGQDTVLHIRVESLEKPLDRYWVTLRYEHNADPGYQEIPIVMNIVEESGLDDNALTPYEFSLSQNYPNPFNPTTEIKYSIPNADQVRISIFDLQGRLIDLIVNDYKKEGKHRITFSAFNLPNGIYFYQLESGKMLSTKKMILLK